MTEHSIVVVGVGRIGAVTAVGLAHLGHNVLGLDRSARRVALLAAGELPEMEPGLRSALAAASRFRRLEFGQAGTERYEFAFLCVDTPSYDTGEPDLRQVFAAAREAARLLEPRGILVTRATVPVGTGERLTNVLHGCGRSDVEVVHLPEFLREGHAWEDFREPDRLVVGGAGAAVERVAAVFAGLSCPVIRTDRRTAELAKYVANAFLATSISFANEMADLSDTLGAHAGTIFEVLRTDRRIGRHAYLTPGLGYGGHCLPKDTTALEQLAASHGRSATQLHATRQINDARTPGVLRWLRCKLGELDGRRVCLAGLAFKAGTDDLRSSPGLRLARALSIEGAIVRGWDPHVRTAIDGVVVCLSLAEAVQDADALVVTNGWDGWSVLEPVELVRLVRTPVVFDASGVLETARWQAAGFMTNSVEPPRAGIAHVEGAPG